jgi:drug/metabolite transporter (DMT)-like permease
VIDWASLEDGWLARALAFGAALSFALYSLATRGARTQDLDAALVAVGIVTALICTIAVYGWACLCQQVSATPRSR